MSGAQSSAGAGSVPAPAVTSAQPSTHVEPRSRPRLARPGDVPEILRLIRELAEYERAVHEVVATERQLTDLMFAAGSGPLPGPVAACHVIDADPTGADPTGADPTGADPTGADPTGADPTGADPTGADPTGADPGAPRAVEPAHPRAGRLAAMALWFRSASTWLAAPGIYLEDLYVSPAYRGRGYGHDLLATLAALCVEHGYGRLEWSVLDWNADAIGFYRSVGAAPMDEWTVHRLTGPALAALALRDPAPGAQAAGAHRARQAHPFG